MEHLVKQDDQDAGHRHQVQHKAVGLKQPLGIDDPVSKRRSDKAQTVPITMEIAVQRIKYRIFL